MYKFPEKFFSSLLWGIAIYLLGFYSGTLSIPAIQTVKGVLHKEDAAVTADFNVFWDAWRSVEEKYVGRNGLNRQNMVYGAVEGMIRSLDDPYSSFFKPDDATMLEDDISGSFSGVGAEIGFKKGILTVIAPLKNSPAAEAGIRSGDTIITIDDAFTRDMSLEEAVRTIRGEKGTTVRLGIVRDEFRGEPQEFSIVRDTIKVPSIEWEMKENSTAHITIFNFTGSIEDEFRVAAQEITRGNAHAIVVDVRDNPGGFLDAAVEVASYFIPRGAIVAQEDFGNGEPKDEFRSKGYQYFQKTPLVVLMNEGSASAAEILAGALKDQRNTSLVGTKTFGKGSVQEVVPLENGTLLKVTVAKWLTPSGISIQDNGITPDNAVEITTEDRDAGKDPQLDAALQLLLK